MKKSIFIFSFLLNLTIFAQQTSFSCIDNLSETISKTEENYAGYPAKVNFHTQKDYRNLVIKLKQRAESSSSPKKCFYVLQDYINFFSDKHFNLVYLNDKDYDDEVIDFAPSYFESGNQKKSLSPIEGIWVNPESTIKIGIIKMKDGTFKALKIESKNDSFPVGFVYFTLQPNGDHFFIKEYNVFGTTKMLAKKVGNLLKVWNSNVWGKVYPENMTDKEQQELSTWKQNNLGLDFQKINNDVALLKIPSFNNNDNKIQELIAKNDTEIRKTKYLIVDLTENGGGNSGWIYFLPYFMTNPIIQAPTFVRVTPDNVKLKLADLAEYVNNPLPEDYKKYFPDFVLNNYKKAYAELPKTKEKFYPVPGVIFPLDSITKNPQKIALVVDNFCGSSTEYFFALSKQSKKTITYGTNTVGMMDYEGQSIPTELPYYNYKLMIPLVKSNWTDTKPIDKTGFKPDVIIKLPQNKWIDFIIEDLKKR